MAVHPLCPCTAASLHTLRDLVVMSGGRLKATIYFVGVDRGPNRNERAADDIPNADISWTTAEEAARFGAMTSGHVTLYRDGKPVFQGGLTACRATEGASAGRFAIESALRGRPFVHEAPVFGCPLAPGDTP